MQEILLKFKKRFLYLGLTIVLLGGIIGVSYAIFFFTGTGTKENRIVTGQIVVNFNESSNIRLTDRYPETDTEGIANSDPRSTSTFTVSSDIVGDVTLNYAIGLTSISEGETLKSNFIKIYMTKNGSPASGFTEGVGKTIKSYAATSIPGYFDKYAIATGTLTRTQVDTYTIKAWVSDTYKPKTEDNTTDTNYTKSTISETFSFKIKLVAIEGDLNLDKKLDTSGANAPELATNMIPVYYDNTNEVWKKADKNNSNELYKWYDYDNKMWANAVTVTSTNRETYLKAAEGTPIPMDDINTMFVWIPRFKATGDYDTSNGTNDRYYNPGAFNITFVNNTTPAHDAFTFGTQVLNGFWMGKFEISHTTLANSTTENNLGCTTNTCSNANGLIIKPNVQALGYNNVSNFFYGMLSMKQSGNSFGFDTSIDSTLDTHMIKGSEWGALAYLTQSIYGRCSGPTSCHELNINNSSGRYTGRSGGNASDMTPINGTYPDQTSTTQYNNFGFYTYDGYLLEYDTNNKTTTKDISKVASTTGNIYGVYDISGGVWDYVMGVYTDGTKQWSGSTNANSGFTGCLGIGCKSTYSGLAYPESKYYNSYQESWPRDDYVKLQHATVETGQWYNDTAYFVKDEAPWLARGGYYGNFYAGVFSIYRLSGGGGLVYGSRAIIVK